mgnify:CR=1 FL=1
MIPRYSRPEMAAIWEPANKFCIWFEIEAHACDALADLGVIPKKAAKAIRKGGNKPYTKARIARIERIEVRVKHDVIAFLTELSEQIGDDGRYVHLGLTSSDVLDTCLAKQLTEATDLLGADIDKLLKVLKRRARQHRLDICIGRSHGIHAELTTFGLKLAGFYAEFERNRERLKAARAEVATCAISGAVGTYATVDPRVEAHVARKLDLTPEPVSTQIIPRDRHAAFFSCLAVIASSVERLATEIRHLQRTEVREGEEFFAPGQKGSSAMPHKRNPELSERVCGLARLIRGHSVTALENVALWGERDISHSSAERIILPDACLALDYILSIFTRVMRDLRVYPQRMWENIESSRGLIFSQRVLLELVDKGMAREDAYAIVQRNAAVGWDQGEDFRQLIKSDEETATYLSEKELDELFDYGYYTRYVDETFQRLGLLPAKITV